MIFVQCLLEFLEKFVFVVTCYPSQLPCKFGKWGKVEENGLMVIKCGTMHGLCDFVKVFKYRNPYVLVLMISSASLFP